MKWLDMKSKLYEIKNLEDGIKSKLDCADLAIVSNQIEAHRERGGKKAKTNKQSFSDLWDNSKQSV